MIQRLVNYINNLSAIDISLNYADVEALYLSVDEKVRGNASILLLPLAAANGVVYGMDMRGGLVPFDFSRITEATYFDKDLNLQIVDSNIPRIDYGNYSKEAKLLIEKISTNYARNGSDLNGISWDSGTVVSVNDQKYTDCFLYTENTSNSSHRVLYPVNRESGSILLKSNGIPYFILRLRVYTAGDSWLLIDAVSGEIIQKEGLIEGKIIVLEDGWLRVEMNSPLANSGSLTIYGSLTDEITASYNNPYQGDGQRGWYFANGQSEEGNTPTSYIPTTTSAVTRSADNLSYILKNNCSIYLKTTNQEAMLDKQAGLWNIHEDLNNEGVEILAIMPDNKLSNVLVDIASAPITQDNALAAINIDKAEYEHIDAVKKLGGVNVGKEAAGENLTIFL